MFGQNELFTQAKYSWVFFSANKKETTDVEAVQKNGTL